MAIFPRALNALIALLTMAPSGTPALAQPNDRTTSDTLFLEIGSPLVDGRVFRPHAALVRIYHGDTLTAEWLNELSIGDSAGRPVMRWITTSHPVPSNPNRVLSVLRQTYDAITLAPLGYSSTTSAGGKTELTIDGRTVRGSTHPAGAPTPTVVNKPIDRLGYFAGASDLVPVAAGLRVGSVLVAPVWGPAMSTAEDRVFAITKDTVVTVEGAAVRSTKVEERRRDGSLYANWYLLRESPYMVYGEVPLPDGRWQRMTEVPAPLQR